MYKKAIKPFLSYFLAAICLLIFSPIMLVVAAAIKIESEGEIIYKQNRLGRNGKIFTIYKFRSMKKNAYNEGAGAYTFEGDERITRIGGFIRKTSIDELPQIFNILKGDMCFIGPRPLLPDIPFTYEAYPEEYKSRFSVMPGMFCLVDTIYRAEASFDIQFKSDAEYVQSISLLNDIKILFKTFIMVIFQKGVYSNSIESKEAVKDYEMSEIN